MRTDAEIKQLVKDVYNNVTCLAVGEKEMYDSFGILIVLGGSALNGACALYEKYSEALPHSINGKPQFMSCGKLNVDEFKRFQIFFEQYEELVSNW